MHYLNPRTKIKDCIYNEDGSPNFVAINTIEKLLAMDERILKHAKLFRQELEILKISIAKNIKS